MDNIERPALDVEARPGVDVGLYCSLARGLYTNASKGRKVASADTTAAHGKLMVTIPGGLAEFERRDPIADSGREERSRATRRQVQ